MVQRLHRLFGRADFRILVLLFMLAAVVSVGWSVTHLSDESRQVGSYEDLIQYYLDHRENHYVIGVPGWYLAADRIETIESTYGLAGFQEQPDWYVTIDMGDLDITPKSSLARHVPPGTKLFIYEDMISGELRIVRDTGETFQKEIAYSSPAWPEIRAGEPYKNFLYRELAKRRIVLQIVLKEPSRSSGKHEAGGFVQPEGIGGGSMMLLMGGGDELAIAEMKRTTNGLLLNLEYTVSFSGTVWSAYTHDAPVCVFTNGGGGGGSPPPPDSTNGCTNCVSDCDLDPADAFNGLESVWTLVHSNLVLTGETFTAWTDTRPMGFDAETNHANRVYGFGRNDIDSDGDGLNDAMEIFTVKTDPEVWDSDSDGVGDGDEWTNGTDPGNPHDPPNVNGTIYYNGQQTNTIRVLAVTDSNSWSLTYSTTLTAPGNFQIANLPASNYWLKAFRDLDGDSSPDAIEALGEYTGNPVLVSNQVTGIEITLTELDSDGDGFSDYEEIDILGTNPSNSQDGELVVSTARSKVVAHWGIINASPLVFTNLPGSQADLNDIQAVLQAIATNFFVGGPNAP